MKLTGPDAVPPPDIFSRLDRMVERLEPAPEPNLNSIASVLARSMMLDIVSWTELIEARRALRVGFDADVEPDTAKSKLIFWWTSRWVSFGLERAEVFFSREVVLLLGPHGDGVDDSIDQLADAGLAVGGVEVAVEVLADDDVELRSSLQNAGTSTFFCSKTLTPFSLPIAAVRISHSISS